MLCLHYESDNFFVSVSCSKVCRYDVYVVMIKKMPWCNISVKLLLTRKDKCLYHINHNITQSQIVYLIHIWWGDVLGNLLKGPVDDVRRCATSIIFLCLSNLPSAREILDCRVSPHLTKRQQITEFSHLELHSKVTSQFLHLYFHCFNILYRTNEVHSSMNTFSLITAQRYGKHYWRQEFPAIFRMLLF